MRRRDRGGREGHPIQGMNEKATEKLAASYVNLKRCYEMFFIADGSEGWLQISESKKIVLVLY